MKDININYIEDNYLEFGEVLKLTNLTSDRLEQLIDDKLIPNASYVIDSEITISSSLNDNHKMVISKRYFAKNIIELIENNKEKIPEKLKDEFRENWLYNLKNHSHKTFAYGNIFDKDEQIKLDEADKIVEEEWEYFCKGVYGICTLNNNENDIINKEVAIKRILDFIEKKSASQISSEKIELEHLNTEFNKSTSFFAPYQRESSSRGKYLDQLLREFSLEGLMKKYN